MYILIACEESQTVCKAFRAKGHEAYSCDIQACSGEHPEWHIKTDVLPLINGNCSFHTSDGTSHSIKGRWNILIAHPPCTYMSNAGACRMYPQKGQINPERLQKAMEAKEFFMKFFTADCERICIENPMPMKIIELPKESQRIQPYEFGDPWSKKTYLWLKGLPPLTPTDILTEWKPFVPSGTGRKLGGTAMVRSNALTTPKTVQKLFPV